MGRKFPQSFPKRVIKKNLQLLKIECLKPLIYRHI
nr:MAG TPA: hypothetical protein [Caudoviricetes sp.]